jgi:hypothetical protein
MPQGHAGSEQTSGIIGGTRIEIGERLTGRIADRAKISIRAKAWLSFSVNSPFTLLPRTTRAADLRVKE